VKPKNIGFEFKNFGIAVSCPQQVAFETLNINIKEP
jgi:hypothetical protein